jgi:hypothetical protein
MPMEEVRAKLPAVFERAAKFGRVALNGSSPSEGVLRSPHCGKCALRSPALVCSPPPLRSIYAALCRLRAA